MAAALVEAEGEAGEAAAGQGAAREVAVRNRQEVPDSAAVAETGVA